jgi:hypothetical protein
MGLYFMGGAACVVVGCLLLVLALVLLRGKDGQPNTPDTPDDAEIVYLTPQKSRTARWVDITTGNLVSINNVTVKVDYAEYGAVRAKDANNVVIESDQKNFLQVYVRLKNYQMTPIDYASWYGNAFAIGNSEVAATLVDDRGRQYDMMRFTHVSGVRGHTPQAVMNQREQVRDIVVFAVPTDIDRSRIRYFRLELPAAAYGGAGAYRFEIPRHAIVGF